MFTSSHRRRLADPLHDATVEHHYKAFAFGTLGLGVLIALFYTFPVAELSRWMSAMMTTFLAAAVP